MLDRIMIESENALRNTFMAIGGYGIYHGLGSLFKLMDMKSNPFSGMIQGLNMLIFLTFIGVVISLGYLICGFKMRDFLDNSPDYLMKLLYIDGGFIVLNLMVLIVYNAISGKAIFNLAFSTVILGYLYVNVKRMIH